MSPPENDLKRKSILQIGSLYSLEWPQKFDLEDLVTPNVSF